MGRDGKFDLQDGLVDCSARVINLVETLPGSKVGKHIAKQLVRSGAAASDDRTKTAVRTGRIKDITSDSIDLFGHGREKRANGRIKAVTTRYNNSALDIPCSTLDIRKAPK